jgi:integrase
VLATTTSKVCSSNGSVYDRTVARAGLEDLDLRGPHDLRHTFAT